MGLRLKVVLLLLLAPVFCAAQEKHEAVLRYALLKEDQSILSTPGFGQEAEVRFKKEPALSESGIFRSAIKLNDARTEFIGFALDPGARKLYVDQNRNLDLTDDPNGTFSSDTSGYYFEFVNIPINYKSGETPLSATVSLGIVAQGGYHWINVRSVWEGDLELYGKRLHFAVTDNLDGVLDHNDQWCADALGDSADANAPMKRFGTLSDHLVFAGRNYDLALEFIPQDDKGAVKVTLTEVTEGLGNVAIGGGNVEVVRFSAKKNVLLLDSAKEFRLPQGLYGVTYVGLTGGYEGTPPQSSTKNILVSEKPAKLEAGAPLKPKVAVSRTGRTLDMQYTLEDAGGFQYRPDTYDKKPSFTVLKDGQTIASGNFEYG